MATEGSLTVEGLRVSFGQGANRREVVHGISFALTPGASLGIIGESGSGKSLTCRAILRLLPPGGQLEGRITLDGVDLTRLSERAMRHYRGSGIGMIFQDPMTALNPVMQVGAAIAQVIAAHERISTRRARRQAIELMERVGIVNAAARSRDYPHEFSGGMRQRIVIAMALAARPLVLLADEPTTALDVIIQAEILRLIESLRRENRMSLLLVSHDIGIVSSMCDDLAVMYAGEVVEVGPTRDVIAAPRHPYTSGLLESLPDGSGEGRLKPIPGAPPDPTTAWAGCAFAPRCPLATDDCREQQIPMISVGSQRGSRCIHISQLVEVHLA